MRSTPARITLLVIVFVAALGGALLLLQQRDASDGPTGAKDGATTSAASRIWKVGTSWTIKVRQDAGAITPDGATSIATIPFLFEVETAPADAKGSWVVRVTQEGAEGPYAAGWSLQYREQDGSMVLHRVAVGSQPPLEAELASIVLGPQFPYEPSYDAPPKSRTIDAAALLERSTLPPGSLPTSGDAGPGVAPPPRAPRPGSGGAPLAPSTPVAPLPDAAP